MKIGFLAGITLLLMFLSFTETKYAQCIHRIGWYPFRQIDCGPPCGFCVDQVPECIPFDDYFCYEQPYQPFKIICCEMNVDVCPMEVNDVSFGPCS